jgi:hypothetical protein
MMEAARTSETLVNFYQTTRCYNPEDSYLHTHRRENLKSYIEIVILIKKYNNNNGVIIIARVLENRGLRKIFSSTREEVQEGRRILHNEERVICTLHLFYQEDRIENNAMCGTSNTLGRDEK